MVGWIMAESRKARVNGEAVQNTCYHRSAIQPGTTNRGSHLQCDTLRLHIYIYITHRTHLYPTLFVWSKDGSWPQKHRNRSPRIYYRYPIYVYPPVNQHSHGHGPFINRWFTRFTIWISIAMEDQEIVRTFHLQSRSQLKHLHLWLTFHTALWCFPLFHLDLKIFKTDKVR